MKEYAEYDVQEIARQFILGEPTVAKTSVLPDETNAPKVTGTGVEDGSVNEGTVTYDIQFRALILNGHKVFQMIINVEAQNDFYPGYPIIKRGIYYCARMISSQYGTVFTKSQYEKIQKVYSVWICMNPPEKRINTITEYSITEKNHIGKAKEKKQILKNEFHIPMTEKLEEEVEHMCNLSDGVENKGIQKGIQQGIMETLVSLFRDGLLTLEEVASRAGMSTEDFQKKMNEM